VDGGGAQFAAEVVAELRRRIVAGELRPGQFMPTAKDVMAEFDVSMAIAYSTFKVMRLEGLLTKVNGSWGFRVTEDAVAIATGWEPPTPPGELTRARLVRAGIELADAGGREAASLRLVAQRAGYVTNTIYKWVRDKADLELLMADGIFAEHPPPASPAGDWRAELELLCRTQWQMYRGHPWVAEIVSFKRPELCPHVAAHTDWAMRALAGLGAEPSALPDLVTAAASLVRGSALEAEPEDELFEFGLQRLLDGFATLAAS